jgi:UDP-glucose 4-epimerase
MAHSRRILLSGISSHWGGRLAQALERQEQVATIIGFDLADPRHELQRTEFVRVGAEEAPLRRIIRAAQIDTIVDIRPGAGENPGGFARALSARLEHTRSLLAAAAGSDSPVRKVVVRGSDSVYGRTRDQPAFLTEQMPAVAVPRTEPEAEAVRVERLIGEFGEANPQVTVTILRFAPAVGAEVRRGQGALLSLPVVPAILGFDPRWQLIHEEDVIGAMLHAIANDLPGAHNAAADGVLALSEAAALLDKPLLPILPPWGTVLGTMALRRLRIAAPAEPIRALRQGRALDNRRLKASGYHFRYTTREAILALRAHQRLRPLLDASASDYRYDREVEEFLRRSPSVRERPRDPVRSRQPGRELSGSGAPAPPQAEPAAGRASAQAAPGAGAAAAYEQLIEEDLLDLIPSLESEAARLLRDHEAAGPARPRVLRALELRLGRVEPTSS